ncbi:major capsid protein [Pseudoalteromonas luteoviolacea]|uniref:major capsid protein n=1 Tax=Pseudoalteromonas luteoviolacea TaxID=43657 RepID=UPI001F23546A|nr:major capsid protein [Pseudoalteromonas luteoviolacea]MCF6442028.1 major capsid protein [Pseudoalteromonas luteoviolacea]
MEVQAALESGKFTITELTAAINEVDAPKTRLAELKLFEEKGIATTDVDIEYKDGQIQLVQDVPRGADGQPLDDPNRKIVSFKAVHLPVLAAVFADDIQNTRAFGQTDELETLQTVINEKLEISRSSLDITIEYLRFGAVFGKVLGKNGSVIVDLFDKFSIKKADGENTIDFNKPLATQLLNVKRSSEKYQKGMKATAYVNLCRPEFFDQLLENPDFVKAFERQNNGAQLREDMRSGVYWQGQWWEEYNESWPNDKDPMPAEYGAVCIPIGKRNLFLTRFAPADYNATVNTIGLPYYTNSEPKKMDKGVDLESQSNPINVCTSPLAVRRIKFTPKTT